jgi:hypothetical protein
MAPQTAGPASEVEGQGRRRGRSQVESQARSPGENTGLTAMTACAHFLAQYGALKLDMGSLRMFPPQAGTSRPPQEPRSDSDAKEPELADTPIHTGREKG